MNLLLAILKLDMPVSSGSIEFIISDIAIVIQEIYDVSSPIVNNPLFIKNSPTAKPTP